MSALDELLSKWRDNPDAGASLALCTYLGTSQRRDLIEEVGSTCEAWHKTDGQVMLAVGRMYLDAGMLPEAQSALVAAGKSGTAQGEAFRYLGEVLLRRGDATRAEKVFARAIQLGRDDSESRMWHDRAVVYVALQRRVGMQAVADEIERTIPRRASLPPPSLQTGGSVRAPKLPPPPHTPPPPPPLAPRAEAESLEDVTIPNIEPPPPFSERTQQMSAARLPDSAYRDSERVRPPRSPPPPPLGLSPARHVAPSLPSFGRGASRNALTEPAPPPRPSSGPPGPSRRALGSVNAAVAADSTPAVVVDSDPQPASSLPPLRAVPQPRTGSPLVDDSASPAPETVLDHLARVGVFEPGGGAAPAWERAPARRTGGIWVFAAAIVLVLGCGVGGFYYARQIKTERAQHARRLESEVAAMLTTGKVSALRATDEKLSEVFELDSRSQQAALLWLRNRVLSALLLPEEPRGIESALHRCKTVGLSDEKTAFGKIASFLAEGDLAGAAALVPKWEKKAAQDPYFELTAAAMLERAGDVRAIGHYKKAIDLDEDFVIARVLHAQLVLLELGAEEAKPFVDAIAKDYGDRAVGRVIQGLRWAVEPGAEEMPKTAQLSEEDREQLPVPLRAIPPALDAVTAGAEHRDDALESLTRALRASATPSMAAWIGFLAIDLGDDELARRAALRALGYSGLYARARALAARVALVGARLQEAQEAIVELDPDVPEVAVVRAVAAYETLDLGSLEAALNAVDVEQKKEAPFAALAFGYHVALGRDYPTEDEREGLPVPTMPWGDIVAVDAALDLGLTDEAKQIVDGWGDRASAPVYALRKSRLLRALGEAGAAEAASADAIVAGGVTPRALIERVFALVDNSNAAAARQLLAKYPTALGPLGDWLKALVDAEANPKRAAVLVSTLEPLGYEAPLLYRIMIARALAATADKRAKGVVGSLMRPAARNPDLVTAAKAIGVMR